MDGWMAGHTFFVNADDEGPHTLLEDLALQIFHYHTQGMTIDDEGYNPKLSGAEWWSLSLDTDDDVGRSGRKEGEG